MRLIIIDDDPIVSQSLKTIIESHATFEVCALGEDGDTVLALYEKHQPDIVLMDIRMKRTSGISAAKEVLARYRTARIVFLTTFSDDQYIVEALHMGAKGYLLKQNYQNITSALEAVMAGQHVFGEDIVSKFVLTRNDNKSDIASRLSESHGITQREYDILCLVGDGKSNKDIAEKLYISEGTVRNIISLLLDKTGFESRTQLAIWFIKQGQCETPN